MSHKALRRSRRQKTAIKSLSKENARLRKAVRKSETRQAGLEVQLAKLRATGAVLSKALFGRRERAAGEAALGAPVQEALCGERRRGLHHRRDRSRGPQPCHPPSAVVPERKTFLPGIPYPPLLGKTLRPPAVAHRRTGDDSPKLSTETGSNSSRDRRPLRQPNDERQNPP